MGNTNENTEYENMRRLCSHLKDALQRTQALKDLTDLKYDPYLGVLAIFTTGERRLINIDGYSDMAMVRKIIMSL